MREGEPVQLACTVSGNASAAANYSWSRNGLRLPEARGDSLELEHVTRGEAGAYSCRVETQRASKTSAPALLAVLCKRHGHAGRLGGDLRKPGWSHVSYRC